MANNRQKAAQAKAAKAALDKAGQALRFAQVYLDAAESMEDVAPLVSMVSDVAGNVMREILALTAPPSPTHAAS